MTWADGVAIAIILLSGILALARGLVREVLGVGAWIGAAIAAVEFYPPVADQIGGFIGNPKLIEPVSIGAVFIVTLIVLSILSAWFASLIRNSVLSGIDRTLGLAFGLARGVFIVCLLYIGLSIFLTPPQWPEGVTDARMLPYAANGASWLAGFLPPAYRPQIDDAGMLQNPPDVPGSGGSNTAGQGGSAPQSPGASPKHAGS